MEIWSIVEVSLITRWRGQGRKPSLSPMDALLMTLMYLHTYLDFSEIGRGFKLSKAAAQKTMFRVLETIRGAFFEEFVKPLSKTVQVEQDNSLN